MPNIEKINDIVIGRFGGNSSAGQYKNEDGCLIWSNVLQDWEIVMILDAHNSAESAELVLKQFEYEKSRIQNTLNFSVSVALQKMDELILEIFQNPNFLVDCCNVQGETACLIVIRKDKFLWWFSVGDCIVHLFNEELLKMGQIQLNQRSFYEWVGQVNTFELPVPCYSTGKRELRQGINHLFLTTDGLTECPGVDFQNPLMIKKQFEKETIETGVWRLLKEIEQHHVRDSTTIISWIINVQEVASQPSNL
ncbi:protein phosphatase 2C domain-containing protein [Viridibacillus sp. YIM B01967]|uniref:Protein phosphatase 2C domain-containing protein n=2 Tax=Viridibacillus soli TaxID=2798301 RepID=A0ABS1HAL2_9BACL|nr:protein phosphatase 2C domain-containing protein [Viridibacillus soli]MBK3496477.1 protein phosphatase 2C domain-containing protein [Viridibacillus soli]